MTILTTLSAACAAHQRLYARADAQLRAYCTLDASGEPIRSTLTAAQRTHIEAIEAEIARVEAVICGGETK